MGCRRGNRVKINDKEFGWINNINDNNGTAVIKYFVAPSVMSTKYVEAGKYNCSIKGGKTRRGRRNRRRTRRN